MERISCRPGCAACCTVITISSPMPGYPDGKPAGEACKHLNEAGYCTLHGGDDYPLVCRNFKATLELCGNSRDEAFRILAELELLTKP